MKRMLLGVWSTILVFLVLTSGCLAPRMRADGWSWQLDVQSSIMRSGSFQPVDRPDGRILLRVSQRHVGAGSIQYVLYRIEANGGDRKIGSRILTGDTPDGQWQALTFSDRQELGTYRLQVYNYGSCLCQGEVRTDSVVSEAAGG